MVILDTNIVIELYKGNVEVRQKCETIGESNLFISAITAAEMFVGTMNKQELPIIKRHVAKFPFLPINEAISERMVRLIETYCLSHHPDIPDMIVAASAFFYEAEIYTLNTKDFRYIPGIRLI